MLTDENIINTVQLKNVIGLKDPSTCFDGKLYHIYGTKLLNNSERFEIVHIVSENFNAIWKEPLEISLNGFDFNSLGFKAELCAPGVIYDEKLFHLFIHTRLFGLGGTIEYFASSDGRNFTWINTALKAIEGSNEAGIYDVQPTKILTNNRYKYFLTYTGFPNPKIEKNKAEIFLAESMTSSFSGPWDRAGCILHQVDVPFQNQQNDPNYEWGMEGSEVIQLNQDNYLMIAVCFLNNKPKGEKQRLFFSHSSSIYGPYNPLDEFIETPLNGENGHGSLLIENDSLIIFYQERSPTFNWQIGFTRTLLTKFMYIEKNIEISPEKLPVATDIVYV